MYKKPAKVFVNSAFVVSALLYKFVIAKLPGFCLTVQGSGDRCEAPSVYLGLYHHVPEHSAGQLQDGDRPVVQEGEHSLEQRWLHNQQQEVAGLGKFCLE